MPRVTTRKSASKAAKSKPASTVLPLDVPAGNHGVRPRPTGDAAAAQDAVINPTSQAPAGGPASTAPLPDNVVGLAVPGAAQQALGPVQPTPPGSVPGSAVPPFTLATLPPMAPPTAVLPSSSPQAQGQVMSQPVQAYSHPPPFLYAPPAAPIPQVAPAPPAIAAPAPAPSLQPSRKGKGNDKVKGKGPGKGKGKGGHREDQPKRGRRPGAQGYTDGDLMRLAQLCKKYLPIGPEGWKHVARKYNKLARKHGRSEREVKGLRAKWDLCVNMPKPTGTAEVPDYLRLIWEVEDDIISKAGTRAINDDESQYSDSSASDSDSTHADAVSIIEISSDTDSDHNGPKATRVTHAPANRATVKKAFRTDGPPTIKRTRSSASSSLLEKIETAFDPRLQDMRDQQRFALQMQANQILSLQAELREVRQQVETFREKAHDAERRAVCYATELRIRSVTSSRKRDRDVFDDDAWCASPYSRKLSLVVSPVSHSTLPITPQRRRLRASQRNATPGPSGVPHSPIKGEHEDRASSPLSWQEVTPKKEDTKVDV